MINDEKYTEILESGLILDHFLLLHNIKQGISLVNTKRIQGFINLLTKKGYIQDDELTEKAFDLLANTEFFTEEKSSGEKTDFLVWAYEVHARCQNKIYELTGARQVRDKIDKKAYNFLPNRTDLTKVLQRVITIYKLKDLEKIEKVLMNYIVRCNDAKSWFPILQYYIMKNGSSQMVTDLENMDEQEESEKPYVSKTKLL